MVKWRSKGEGESRGVWKEMRVGGSTLKVPKSRAVNRSAAGVEAAEFEFRAPPFAQESGQGRGSGCWQVRCCPRR